MRYKILSVCAALAVVTACGDLTSINQNPNGPVDVPPPTLLGNLIQNVVGGVNGVMVGDSITEESRTPSALYRRAKPRMSRTGPPWGES